jgi:mannose-6-phosphate isomerase-like protein (cupin superfamily)
MPIIRSTDAPRFELPDLVVLGLASPKRGARETCVWRVSLAPGAPGFPHTVTREEVFVATQGSAVATLSGESYNLEVGDALVVPAGVPFSIANRSALPFEAVVSFPVGGKAVTGEGELTPPWTE